MNEKALTVYLNDHLGGAMFGSDLARMIRKRGEGTRLGDAMEPIARDIEEDRQTLRKLIERLGTSRNPFKQAGAWIGEKAGRAKFGGLTRAKREFGLYLAIETLALGVQGKLALWTALKDISDEHSALDDAQLDELIERARAQHTALEAERLVAARRLFVENEPVER